MSSVKELPSVCEVACVDVFPLEVARLAKYQPGYSSLQLKVVKRDIYHATDGVVLS